MFVLGTAGHIDHGKSTLVRALTGIDPDRLPEEKERSMTIDLGFAWLKLPSGQEVGIVDVPGHERFVRNMLAGVGGIDLALLIIAANEGVQPQTREHLAILDLLKVRRGIVAITKKDLVDADLLSVVKMEIEELLKDTSLAGSPMVAVSAFTGEGIPELKGTIDKILKSAEPRKDLGRPRLPVDRIFTIVGAGTIVTGTLIDGSLSVGQEVEIVPSGLKSRLRGLQTHKSKVETAGPGSRVAANVVGITTSEVQRGDVLTRLGWLKATTMVTVKLRLLSKIKYPLRHNAEVSFHTGAAETLAKVRLLEAEKAQGGETVWAQIVLAKPVAVLKGDRFIVRSTMDTLGGGDVVDTEAKRLKRFRANIIEGLKVREQGTPDEIILALLETKQPLEVSAFLSQSTLLLAEARRLVESLVKEGRIVALGQGEHALLLTTPGWDNLSQKTAAFLDEYHRRFPTRTGMPRVELGSRLKLAAYIPAILARLARQGTVVEEGTAVRLASHSVQLAPAQQAKIDAFLKSLLKDPYSPPAELVPEPDLLNLLIEQRKVVKVSENVIFAASAYDEMVERIKLHIKANGKVSLGEVRDMFKTSRKYAQALLEYLDAKKITRRVGDERVLL